MNISAAMSAAKPVPISLRAFIHQFDEEESRVDHLLSCYKRVIDCVRTNLVMTQPSLRRQIRTRLGRLLATFERGASAEMLEASVQRFGEAMVEYRNEEESAYQEEQHQLRRTVLALEDFVQSIDSQDEERSQELNDVTIRLEDALLQSDLSDIHRTLQDQIRRLRTCLIAISNDAYTRQLEVGTQIASLKEHSGPESAFEVESRDSRTEAEDQLRRCMADYSLFSLVLLKVEDLGAIADYWGGACRNRLLELFEARLKRLLSASDLVSPWGLGEFLIVMRSTLSVATERITDIQAVLTTSYKLDLPLGSAEISLRTAAGVAEFAAGESIEILTERAELMLFRSRHRSGPVLEPSPQR